jgi:hypothetical protein
MMRLWHAAGVMKMPRPNHLVGHEASKGGGGLFPGTMVVTMVMMMIEANDGRHGQEDAHHHQLQKQQHARESSMEQYP